MGKIRMTVAQKAELAQSYIAHARSSGRWRPRRSSRGIRAMLASRVAQAYPSSETLSAACRARRAGISFSRIFPEVPMLSSPVSRVTLAAGLAIAGSGPLASAQAIDLRNARVVDLSHPFDERTLYWP